MTRGKKNLENRWQDNSVFESLKINMVLKNDPKSFAWKPHLCLIIFLWDALKSMFLWRLVFWNWFEGCLIPKLLPGFLVFSPLPSFYKFNFLYFCIFKIEIPCGSYAQRPQTRPVGHSWGIQNAHWNKLNLSWSLKYGCELGRQVVGWNISTVSTIGKKKLPLHS